jgi:hypothetical protein
MASSQSPTGKAPASTHLPPFDLSEKTNKSGQAIGEAAEKFAGKEGDKGMLLDLPPYCYCDSSLSHTRQ